VIYRINCKLCYKITFEFQATSVGRLKRYSFSR